MKVLCLLVILGLPPLASNGSPFEIHPTAGLPSTTTKRLPIKDDPNGNDVFLEPEVIVDSSHIKSAEVVVEKVGKNTFISVRTTFTPEGAKRLAAAVGKILDEKNSNRQLAIVCNGVVIEAVGLHDRLSGEVVEISCKTKQRAEAIAEAINQTIKK